MKELLLTKDKNLECKESEISHLNSKIEENQKVHLNSSSEI